MVWNIKYGTLQSWETLDKLTAKQSSLPRSVQMNGACCACFIPGFICVGFCHSVAVCQFSVETSSLASSLGQSDSTAKYVVVEFTGQFLYVQIEGPHGSITVFCPILG